MKAFIKYLLIIISLMTSLCANAQMEKSPFSSILNYDDVYYTYISPEILSNMGDDKVISSDIFTIMGNQLNCLEIIKSYEHVSDIKTLVANYAKENNLILLSSSSNSMRKVTIYAKLDKKEKNMVKELLIYTLEPVNYSTVTLMKGNIRLVWNNLAL